MKVVELIQKLKKMPEDKEVILVIRDGKPLQSQLKHGSEIYITEREAVFIQARTKEYIYSEKAELDSIVRNVKGQNITS